MGNIKLYINKEIDDQLLKNYDLIVNPINYSMGYSNNFNNVIIKKMCKNKTRKYIMKKYKITKFKNNNYMKLNDIRITPGFNLKIDIMFIYDIINEKISNKEDIFRLYELLLNIAYKNEYHDIFIINNGNLLGGYSHKEIGHNMYKIIDKFIKDKDINITLFLLSKKYEKYYK